MLSNRRICIYLPIPFLGHIFAKFIYNESFGNVVTAVYTFLVWHKHWAVFKESIFLINSSYVRIILNRRCYHESVVVIRKSGFV